MKNVFVIFLLLWPTETTEKLAQATRSDETTTSSSSSSSRTSRIKIESDRDLLREVNIRQEWENWKVDQGIISDTAESADSVADESDEELSLQRARQVSALHIANALDKFDSHFDGNIGGMDEVIATIKERVWIPLAAPPQLLDDLGIQPVRGLLLYGPPGCGKSLLAKHLSVVLSPLRTPTFVSGPEILDKFVGSSERNLRNIFDNPPDLWDESLRSIEEISKSALHVVVLDEFDAISRERGNGDGSDARIARDSLVNQLLAKMDGVSPLKVPTLVVALTNKRNLIDPALLRPGRFEVQIEIPAPKSAKEIESIFRVHLRHMNSRGRLLTKEIKQEANIPTYDELVESLSKSCEGCTGAIVAGIVRAAASRALSRSVNQHSEIDTSVDSMFCECVVTADDLFDATRKALS